MTAQSDPDPRDHDGKHTASQATKLVALGSRTPLFHDPEGNAYATVPIGDHDETWRLRSGGFRSWLARQYWELEGAIPRAGALQDALTALEGLARFDGPEIVVHLRHAHVDGVLYVDLGDPAWRAIEVTAAGWRIVSDPPVRFRRPRGTISAPPDARCHRRRSKSLQSLENRLAKAGSLLVAGILCFIPPTASLRSHRNRREGGGRGGCQAPGGLFPLRKSSTSSRFWKRRNSPEQWSVS